MMNMSRLINFSLQAVGSVLLLANGAATLVLTDARDQLAAKYCGSSDVKGYMERRVEELRASGKGTIKTLRRMATESNYQYQGCGIAFLERLEDYESQFRHCQR
jgi:hypothetical protein